VAPSPAFRAHLGEELLQTAKALPRYQGSAVPVFLGDAGAHRNAYAWSGFLLGLGAVLLAFLFLWQQKRQAEKCSFIIPKRERG